MSEVNDEHMNNLHTFKTGAVRSNDADEFRFDLITPVGWQALRRAQAPGGAREGGCDNHKWAWLALDCTYRALDDTRGERDFAERLAEAALCLCHAIAAHERPTKMSLRSGPVPVEGLFALARTCKEGADKYGDFNWERGMPAHDLLNHAIRHMLLHLSPDPGDEPHLAHALWGLLAAIHSFERWIGLNNQKLRCTGGVPPQTEEASE